MDEEIKKLTEAVAKKTQAEIERARLEENRISIETKRLDKESRNSEILQTNANKMVRLLELMVNELVPEVKNQGMRIEIILEFVKTFSGWLYSQGYKEAERLDALINNIGQKGDMKVEIKPGRDAMIGDIIEGKKIICDTDIIVNMLGEIIDNDNVERAETILNTLPKDALDVILAAMVSKFAAAKVVVEKIGEKIKLLKK